jgi:hypothetical protein
MSGEDTIGPVPVPEEVSTKLKCGWQMGLLLGKTRRGWRIKEVGDISLMKSELENAELKKCAIFQ